MSGCLRKLPVNVLSHCPAFQSMMVLSADPDSMSPCSGNMATAHTAAEWPCSVIMHFSLSHTLAVVSQEPLKSVPNFPEDRVQTVDIQRCKDDTVHMTANIIFDSLFPQYTTPRYRDWGLNSHYLLPNQDRDFHG